MKQKLGRVGVLIVLLTVALTGCGGASAVAVEEPLVVEEPATAEAVVADTASEMVELGPEVQPETVADLAAQGQITIIDVREDWEFAEGHIAGATLIPLGSLPDRISEIPTDKPVVLVCRSGNRSGQAFQYLTGEGYNNVSNMVGGMNAWSAAGLGTEK